MLKISVFLFVCAFSHYLWGQDLPPEPIDKVRYGLSFSFDQTDRNVVRTAGSGTHDQLYRTDGYSSMRIGFAAGLDVRVPISTRAALFTGLRYADRGFRSRAYASSYIHDSLGVVEGTPVEITHGYHFQYLQVPFMFQYQFGLRRLRPTIAAGIELGYLLGVYRVNYDEIPEGNNQKERVEDIFNFQQLDLSPVLSIGLTHQTTDRIWLRLELLGRYGVLPVTRPPERGYLYNASILFGVLYSFTTT